MREQIQVTEQESIILMAEKVVYSQEPYWGNGSYRQLSLSILHPREYYEQDSRGVYPLIVFFCGGAFQKMDRNVWMPELVRFAKSGYVVASVDYSVLPYTRFPEALKEIKTALRFLRANAKRFSIDTERVAVMGESAGGTLSALMGVTSGTREFDTEEYAEFSSAVQAVVAYYPATNTHVIPEEHYTKFNIRVDHSSYPDICTMIPENCPPMYLLHGLSDEVLPYSQSVNLYEALQEQGIPCDLTLVEGANHADTKFYQTEIKTKVLQFLDKHLKNT